MQQLAAAGFPGQPAERGGRIRPALLSLAFCYLVVLGGTGYSSAIFSLHVVARVATFAVLGGWLVWKLRRGEGLPRTSLDVPLVFMLLFLTLSTALSREPRLSLDRAVLLGSFALSYYLFVDLRRRGWREEWFWKALLSAGMLVVVLGLAEVAGWYFGLTPFLGHSVSWTSLAAEYGAIPPAGFRLFATMWNPNVLAGYLVLAAPLLLATMINEKRSLGRVAAILLAGCVGVVSFFTSSRGGWLGIAIGVMCLAALLALPRYVPALFHPKQESTGPASRNTLRRVPPGKIAAAVVGLLLIVASLVGVLACWPGRTGTISLRLEMWQVAWQSGLAHPLCGEGPGTFPLALLPHLAEVNGLSDLMPHAHNALLNLFAESGVGAVLAAVAMVAAVVWQGLRYYANHGSKRERVWAAAGISALLGLAAHNMVDDLTAIPAIMVPAIVIAAMIMSRHRASHAFSLSSLSAGGEANPPTPLVRGAFTLPVRRAFTLPARRAFTLHGVLITSVVVLGVAVACFTGYEAYARYFYEEGVGAGRAGDWDRAATMFDRAASLDPAMSIYQFQRGVAYAWLSAMSSAAGDSTSSGSYLSRALQAMETGMKREPDCALNVANMAAVHWALGDREPAITEMQRAVALEPKNSLFWYRLGSYYETGGKAEEAAVAYSKAVQLDPSLFEPGGWRLSGFRRQNEQAILGMALRGSGSRAGEVYAGYVLAMAPEGGASPADIERAVALGGLSPDTRARLAVALSNGGENEQGLVMLSESGAQSPGSAVVIAAKGEMSALNGDWQRAERFAKLAAFIDDTPEANHLLGEVWLEEAKNLEAAAALRASLPSWPYEWAESYGSLVYGVNAPGIDVTPQLVGQDRMAVQAGRYSEYAGLLRRLGFDKQAQAVDNEVAAWAPFAKLLVRSGSAETASEGWEP